MNIVIVTGRLSRDPTMQYVGQNRFPILSMNVVVDNAGGRYNPETKKTEVESGFYQVEVKGDYATNFADLKKGDSVYVQGSLTQWTKPPKDGEERSETKTRISAELVMPLTASGGGAPAVRSVAAPGLAPAEDDWGSGWPNDPGRF